MPWLILIVGGLAAYEALKHWGGHSVTTTSFWTPVVDANLHVTGKQVMWHATNAQSKAFGPQRPVAYATSSGGTGFFLFQKSANIPALSTLQPGQVSTYYYLYQPDWTVKLV